MVPEVDDGPPDLLADVPCGPPLVWSALTPIIEPLPNKSVDANVSVAIVRLILFILPPVSGLFVVDYFTRNSFANITVSYN
jgi:hypothetical protein